MHTSEIKEKSEAPMVLLFTGHMIDAKNRKEARFPPERELEVRLKIKKSITETLRTAPDENHVVGISGGACGGDLLFLEVCKELGVKVKMLLALPAEKFIAESVSFAGNSWVERFYAIYDDPNTEVSVLAESKELWASANEQDEFSFWERNNLWLLNTALSLASGNLTLITVWDGKGEDGPGGTRHMIEEVKKTGAKTVIIGL